MNIHIRQQETVLVVEVDGDVDMASSPRLRDTVLELVGERAETKIVLNLERVDYIDSSGIASLVEALQQARKRKMRLILAGLQEGPRHVLQLTRLLDVFEVHASEAEALEA